MENEQWYGFKTEEQFLCWVAGFFDGEGCVDIHLTKRQNSERYCLHVTVGQNVEAPLVAMQAEFGGRVSLRKSGLWCWNVNADEAANFLIAVRPYLRRKATDAVIGIEFQRLNTKKGQATLQDVIKVSGQNSAYVDLHISGKRPCVIIDKAIKELNWVSIHNRAAISLPLKRALFQNLRSSRRAA